MPLSTKFTVQKPTKIRPPIELDLCIAGLPNLDLRTRFFLRLVTIRDLHLAIRVLALVMRKTDDRADG
jgi:hypothetical protein